MCYHVSYSTNIELASSYIPKLVFDEPIQLDLNLTMHIHGFINAEHPIIYLNKEDNQPHMRMMEWGILMPYFNKEYDELLKKYADNKAEADKAFRAYVKKQRGDLLNARSEKILTEKKLWHRLKSNRCLIPLTGIYEHRKVAGFKNKIPYHIRPKDQPIFFLPGLYNSGSILEPETGELVKHTTFTLLTRAANPIMKQIHNDGPNKGRMPLFLPLKMSLDWLNPNLTEQQYADILAYEMLAEDLDYCTVYTIVGTGYRPDDKAKYEPWEWQGLPPLGQDAIAQNTLF